MSIIQLPGRLRQEHCRFFCGLSALQSKFKANLGNLVGTCFKIKMKCKGQGCHSSAQCELGWVLGPSILVGWGEEGECICTSNINKMVFGC